jgi:hypothetical protein
MASDSPASTGSPRAGLAQRGVRAVLGLAALACIAGGVVIAASAHGDTAFGFAVALWAIALMFGTVALALNFDGDEGGPAPPADPED